MLKRVFLLLIVFLSLISGLPAIILILLPEEYSSHNYYLGASFGTLYGNARGIDYRNADSDTVEGEQLWNLSLPYIGVDMRYIWQDQALTWGFFMDTTAKFGFKSSVDNMETRGWYNPANANILTDFTSHNSEVTRARLLDINAGLSFNIYDTVFLKPFISYSYMNFSWTARGGSGFFTDPPFIGTIPDSTEFANYRQTWNILSLGLAIRNETRHLDVELGVKLSPFVWASTETNLFSPMENIRQTTDSFVAFYAEPNLILTVKNTHFYRLSLSISRRSIVGLRGDQEMTTNGVRETFRNSGGAAFSAIDMSLIFHAIGVGALRTDGSTP